MRHLASFRLMATKSSIPRTAAFASALLLLFSLLPIWPAVYFVLLRYIAGITAVLLAVQAEELRKRRWIWVWITVAILLNPIAPSLRRGVVRGTKHAARTPCRA